MMTPNRDHLDEAIDAVAARLTKVAEDDALAARIVSSLPERRAGLTWIFSGWAPRLAMVAMIVAAGIVWGRQQTTAPQLDPLASTLTATEPAAFVATVQEAEPNRTTPLERLEPLEPMEPAADFERSLPSLGAMAVLEFDSLAPVSLPEDAPLTLEPLAIADLPLTAEFSPR